MTTITANDARAEMYRRALPKDDPARKHVDGDPEAPLASTTPAFRLSAGELQALAGTPAPAKATRKAKAKVAKTKPVRTPEQVAATKAREQAWAYRQAERAAGRKVTYAEACAKFGTTPAKAKA